MRLEIIKEMERQGVNQTELAEKSGIPAPRLSEWLSGKRPRGATEQTINAVMKALGMTVHSTRKAKSGGR